jgi:guanosine-3',5'-bis(diphosphate) 3'-pyrophosphohydrolase
MDKAQTGSDLPLVLRALLFAARKHRDQRRKDVEASPYINHPIALANLLCNEAGETDVTVLCSALLHDTVEDTDTTAEELEREFGPQIRDIVLEVTDDNRLPKTERKRQQVENAKEASRGARLVKLADKTCNLRDLAESPPANWPAERIEAYYHWAKEVVDRLRGTHERLEQLFDQAYAKRPDTMERKP